MKFLFHHQIDNLHIFSQLQDNLAGFYRSSYVDRINNVTKTIGTTQESCFFTQLGPNKRNSRIELGKGYTDTTVG